MPESSDFVFVFCFHVFHGRPAMPVSPSVLDSGMRRNDGIKSNPLNGIMRKATRRGSPSSGLPLKGGVISTGLPSHCRDRPPRLSSRRTTTGGCPYPPYPQSFSWSQSEQSLLPQSELTLPAEFLLEPVEHVGRADGVVVALAVLGAAFFHGEHPKRLVFRAYGVIERLRVF